MKFDAADSDSDGEEDATTGKEEAGEVSANGKQNGGNVAEVVEVSANGKQNGGNVVEPEEAPTPQETNGKPSSTDAEAPAATPPAANGGEKEPEGASPGEAEGPPTVCELCCRHVLHHIIAPCSQTTYFT